jgi:MYXO-CTERM domain-containing protein
MQISASNRSWFLRFAIGGLALLAPRPSQASQEFPAAIQAAAGMPCTPSCVLCHGVDPGTAGTYGNKKLGATLSAYNNIFVTAGNTAVLTSNYNAYKATAEGAAVDASLKQGIDPETKADLCSSGPSYGCGAHVAAKAPPSDLSPLAWALGAMVLGAVVRRQRSRSA